MGPSFYLRRDPLVLKCELFSGVRVVLPQLWNQVMPMRLKAQCLTVLGSAETRDQSLESDTLDFFPIIYTLTLCL